MDARIIIRECEQRNISLLVVDGVLKYRAPKGSMDDNFKTALQAHKAKIIRLLEPDRLIMCPYKGQPREVFPSVCEWHQEENDPVCSGCKNRVLH